MMLCQQIYHVQRENVQPCLMAEDTIGGEK